MPNKYQTPKRGGKGGGGGGNAGSASNKKGGSRQTAATSSKKKKVKAVDVVTGKATTEYFFDPSLVIAGSESSTFTSTSTTPFKASSSSSSLSSSVPKSYESQQEMLFASKHLFVPCTIIKPLDAENEEKKSGSQTPYPGPTLVKTSDGALHKISDSTKLFALRTPEDYTGMPDVLHLPAISEASLLHSLRIRYKRDDIYTSAGPILISVNPYKQVVLGSNGQSIYSEEQMLLYRSGSNSIAATSTSSSGAGTGSSSSSNEKAPPHLFQTADHAYTALMESVHAQSNHHIDDEDAVLLLENHRPPGLVRNQSIIISGESGAGKTEATKIIMKYLARITRHKSSSSSSSSKKKEVVGQEDSLLSPDGKRIAALEDRVLSSNPLLETFGNAKTLRNDNSSRFGKFIYIYFDVISGSISGASISNYLLEKTRITTQVEGERNYHIFYQLLSGCSPETLQSYGLQGGVSSFNYLKNNSIINNNNNSNNNQEDANALETTRTCLSSIGVGQEEQEALFAMVAAVLHLGNVQFEEKTNHDDNDAQITAASMPSLTKACELLGLDPERVSQAILTKRFTVNGKVIKKTQTVAVAEDKRDALAKMTYSSLFLWLVQSINATLDTTRAVMSSSLQDGDINSDNITTRARQCQDNTNGRIGFIGVLDIYGFESFETNGFEQLLINYCNEKLQRHFNRHLFEVEQELYANEGVDWSYITFNDNRPCLELIEGGSGIVGILNTLDDAWGGMGTASEKDCKFVAHLHKQFGSVSEGRTPPSNNSTSSSNLNSAGGDDAEGSSGHKNFITPKFGKDRQFLIVHYAGEVRYTADGFVEKNMETLSNELRELGDETTLPLAKKVFACTSAENQPAQRSSIRGISVGSQFRTSLQSLVADLDLTQPHYIRCIKPNLTKSPSAFMAGEVLKQLRYSGMIEAIRIRREGYAMREEHESFYNRFSVLLTSEELENGDASGEAGIEQLVKVLSKRLNVTDADWQIGHSKIFLRRELSDKLERFAKLRVYSASRVLCRFAKHVTFSRLSRFLVAWVRFRMHMRKYYRDSRAASLLAAWVHRVYDQRRFRSFRKAVVLVQAEQRRKNAIEQVRKIRDPYCDMSFRDCKRLLKSHQERLEEAVKDKKFRQAADLESKIDSLKAAVEAKCPLTRAVLDAKIEEVNSKLDDAIQRKAFTECGPLQETLEELTNKRAELPTAEELRQKVLVAEEAVALAAKNKDFSAAAMAQTKLDECRQRLEEALASWDGEEGSEGEMDEKENNILGFESRAQLEQAITALSAEIKAAIASKDFTKATTLQQSLDEKENLRKFFPTLDELQTQLKNAQRDLEVAVSKKDFVQAGKLDEVVAKLEKKIDMEKEARVDSNSGVDTQLSVMTLDGGKKAFQSRGELEKEITDLTKRVSEAVSKKEFRNADELQKSVDALKELRQSLPSLLELEQQLSIKKKDLEKAIAGKRFAEADDIHVSIEGLEKKIAKERTLVPSPAMGDASVKSMPVVPSSTVSVKSNRSIPVKPTGVTGMRPIEIKTLSNSKTVKSLRPKKPIIAAASDSILSVIQLLTARRSDASILVDPKGHLAGILTDTDVTRRVVAKDIDAASVSAAEVMTPNPTCVSLTDSAMDALSAMLENHFRHLPVIDESGAVVGLLDIAKCLNDAISKLELSQEKSSSAAEDVVKQVVGGAGAQNAALQALLGNLMAQAFGNKKMPTLRSVLAGKPSTVVSPTTPVRDVGQIMAEHRKAALVVDNGKLVGIFGFKDMMTRVVAKCLPLDTTPVQDVMTEQPESVLPEVTVLEALQTMHDHKFLTLPVCEEDGRVVGVVGVMDVIYGCGGAEGWRSLFDSIDIDDDMSAVSAASNATGKLPANTVPVPPSPSGGKGLGALDECDERQVSKLRPNRPIISSWDDSVLSVSQLLRSKRGAASLVVSAEGTLSGIITDTDITRRVVAKKMDAACTTVGQVMTENPTCVAMNDPAIDALTTMVDNHFRHLPVVDESGSVVGLLDIAKCLNHAISRLEQSQSKTTSAAEDAVKQVVNQHGATGAQATALQALLGNLMSQAMGHATVPTLRTVLMNKPKPIISPTTSVQDAAFVMAESRKAVIVVDDNGRLVGLFGFKDMMTRVVAKELPLETTLIRDVMTSSPEFVTPDVTVLDALQTMHDDKFLTLPVCEEDGRALGVVGVMDVISACGGSEGWKSVFQHSMDVGGDDDRSVFSAPSVDGSIKSASTAGSKKRQKKDEKTVANLRPAKPVISTTNETILSVTQALQRKRASASLIVSSDNRLAGILTDTDVTRRVVAKDIDAASVSVAEVMTRDPNSVTMTDPAVNALMLMVDNHYRHLPVLDDEGSVVGLLDIAKCLNDAISKLEQSNEKNASAAEYAVKQAVGQHGATGAQTAAIQALLRSLMAQAFGNQAMPTLRSVLAGKPSTIVGPSSTIREVGRIMAEHRKAALVVDNGELVGIFGFKDMMSRVVAKELPLDTTQVQDVMTPSPEFVSPEISVLEALQTMHDNKFLTLPVCEEDGRVVGVVDVMTVIHGCGGAEGWRSMFKKSMELDDLTECRSTAGSASASVVKPLPSVKRDFPTIKVAPTTPGIGGLPANIPTKLEFGEDDMSASKLLGPDDFSCTMDLVSGVFKVNGPDGSTHKIRCACRVEDLIALVAEKLGVHQQFVQISYMDEEGDTVAVTCDDDVAEAWNHARKAGNKIAKISASVIQKKGGGVPLPLMVGVGVAVVGAVAFMLLRSAKR